MTLLRPTLVATAALVLFVGGSQARSHADTPKFPDFSGYTPVTVADYEVDISSPGISNQGIYFLTPDGIVCAIAEPPGAGCTGNNLPGVPPVVGSPAGKYGMNDIETDAGLRTTNSPYSTNGTVHGNPVKTLPPFHTITALGVTCGVDDSGTTACKDPQGRGFVLSPKGSGWLPHV
jgi:hypothetical protein